MGEKYEIPLAEFMTKGFSDMATGDNEFAQLGRDFVDNMVDTGEWEPMEETVLANFAFVWAKITSKTAEAFAGKTVKLEKPGP